MRREGNVLPIFGCRFCGRANEDPRRWAKGERMCPDCEDNPPSHKVKEAGDGPE